MTSDELTYPNACLAFIFLMLLFMPDWELNVFPVDISLHLANFKCCILTARFSSATKEKTLTMKTCLKAVSEPKYKGGYTLTQKF